MDAGGSSKSKRAPTPRRRRRRLSITLPCLVKKVEPCASVMPKLSVLTQMGTVATTSFVSSTSVTVASRHAPLAPSPTPCSTIAALSRNLHVATYETLSQPLVDTLRRLDLVQLGVVVGQPESPLSEGGDEHPERWRERAALGQHPVSVGPSGGEEDGERGGHDGGQHERGGAPSEAVLRVDDDDDDGDAEQDARAERAVPPVEGGHLAHPLPRVGVVELVRAEALQRRFVAGRAVGDEVDAREEERLVQARRAVGIQDRRQLRRRQDRQTLMR